MHSSLGEHDELPVSVFFREPPDLFPFDLAGLDACRGRVLDAGAGTGMHSLMLQERGLEVVAVELVPEAVAIMRARGVVDVRQQDMLDLGDERFDTVLMMMNDSGPLGTLAGLDLFLGESAALLRPGGQILLDSAPANLVGEAPVPLEGQPATDPGAYVGEAWIRLEYGAMVGELFRELYVDADTLARHATAAGWRCDPIFLDADHGSYVARLRRP